MASTARELGFQLLPWQRLTLSTALERSGRRPAYRDCLVSIGRQQGKSSLLFCLIVWRLLAEPGVLVLYAAQNRLAARRKLLHTWWPRIAASPLAGRFKLFRGFGAEMLQADNGSRLELLSANESAGHGESCDLVVVDEAWSFADPSIEQSTRPTMLARPGAQLWIVSTAGTLKSTWWRSKLDAARTSAELGQTTGTCLLEWAAAPDADPADPATWWRCMPALGRLIEPETVRRDLAAMGAAQFRRGYMNVWSDEGDTGWAVIDRDLWAASRL